MWLERYKQNNNFDLEEIKQYWCTSYALQRAYEGSGYKYKFFVDRAIGGFPNAENWFIKTCLPKGDTARVGAIACWSGGEFGHVAYVEDCQNNHIKVSQANQNSTFFITEHDVEVGKTNSELGTGYVFQGFIYTPINDIRVNRDITQTQVEVLADLLRVRAKPNGANVGGLACPKGIYNCDIVENDGVLWAKLEEESWIMINDQDGWTVTYIKKEGTMEEIISQIETLLKTLKEKIASETADKKTIKEQLDDANNKLEKIKEIL